MSQDQSGEHMAVDPVDRLLAIVTKAPEWLNVKNPKRAMELCQAAEQRELSSVEWDELRELFEDAVDPKRAQAIAARVMEKIQLG